MSGEALKQFEMTKSKTQPYIQTLPCLNDIRLNRVNELKNKIGMNQTKMSLA